MSESFNPVEWITTAEAAKLTGYSLSNLQKAAKRGRLKSVVRGRTRFFQKDDLLIYVQKMKDLGVKKYIPQRFQEQTLEEIPQG